MPVFQFTAAGETWRLEPLTNRRAREVAVKTGVDILTAVEKDGQIAELLLNAKTSLRFAFDVVADQHPDVTFEQFTDDLTGDDVDAVLEVLWQWVADFTRSSRFGHLLRAKGATGVRAMIQTKLDEMSAKATADPGPPAKSSELATSSPGSSGSTPTTGATDSSTGPPPPGAGATGSGPTP